ncbi:AraC family transcriptional regulator [Bradyrhizobium sp. Tv2a-2]|uniref:AraC family transcriptional regulator n=1 Tax=Bradyrhizobium sp. Tv2a-2 TaxID=113395 RepID=UPI000685ADC0|nr:AraC family transcriptional regulator [Bradyrhizobium sp. Tv2a-2]
MSFPRKSPLHAVPSATGALARMACTRLHAAGLPVAPLLEKAGLTAGEVEDPGRRIEVSAQVKFLKLAADALQDDLLGFRLSQSFDLRETGLLYYILSSSDSFADAMSNTERYTRIVNEGIELKFEASGAVITVDYVGVERLSDRHQFEFWLFSIVRMCRQITGTRLAPRRFSFRHRRESTPPECRAFLGCEVTYGANVDEIVLPAQVNVLPIVGTDRYLHEMLLRYAEEALAGRTPERTGLRSRVEHTIGPLLPHGKAKASTVAKELGVSHRTLARSLAAEGLTFSGILDQSKADLAKSYLTHGDLSISQIAWLLGYREVSTFTHAFKRWYGITPTELRAGAGTATTA